MGGGGGGGQCWRPGCVAGRAERRQPEGLGAREREDEAVSCCCGEGQIQEREGTPRWGWGPSRWDSPSTMGREHSRLGKWLSHGAPCCPSPDAGSTHRGARSTHRHITCLNPAAGSHRLTPRCPGQVGGTLSLAVLCFDTGTIAPPHSVTRRYDTGVCVQPQAPRSHFWPRGPTVISGIAVSPAPGGPTLEGAGGKLPAGKNLPFLPPSGPQCPPGSAVSVGQRGGGGAWGRVFEGCW